MVILRVNGPIPAKKNNYRRGPSGRLFIDKEVAKRIEAITLALRVQANTFECPLPLKPARVYIFFGVSHTKADLDGMRTTLLDCLQPTRERKTKKGVSIKLGAGLLLNDNAAHVVSGGDDWRLVPKGQEFAEIRIAAANYDRTGKRD